MCFCQLERPQTTTSESACLSSAANLRQGAAIPRYCPNVDHSNHPNMIHVDGLTGGPLWSRFGPPASFIKAKRPKKSFDFGLGNDGSGRKQQPQQQQQPLRHKRPRHRLDVDGPNTAGLASKKRRLRLRLVTSRLSEPYSQPATYIMSRKALKSSQRRFCNLATAFDIARRHHSHVHTSSLLRFSLTNQLRQRLGLGPLPGHQAVQAATHQLPDSAGGTMAAAPWARRQVDRQLDPGSETRAPAGAAGRVTQSRSQVPSLGLPSPPPSQPVYAESQPSPSAYDELEEDGFDTLGVGEGEDGHVGSEKTCVYSDFSVIFGASDADASYEEYLDELDGISWASI